MTQSEALAILKTGANVFLTGEPGSGKTHIINEFIGWLRSSGIEPSVTAATGIAATHIDGVTLHSWSGIGIAESLSSMEVDRIASKEHIARRIQKTKVLIIEEISMLSATTFEMVDTICREVRRTDQPFGGLTLILVGDFFQLPPVSRSRAATFAYASASWHNLNPIVCYLTKQYRQDDTEFLSVLSAIRAGRIEQIHYEELTARRVESGMFPNAAPKLFSHNVDVDRVNAEELAKLPGVSRKFHMTTKGKDSLVEGLKRGCLSPETLELKENAAVMFTKNSPQGKFVNGTLGIVRGWGVDGLPLIETRDGFAFSVEPMEWQVEEQGKVRASVSQVPLRLAYAMTVHKSQGMSMDEAIIDLSRAFEYGQGYVALSRVRRLSGLYLLGLNERALLVHPEILEKDKDFRMASDTAQEAFTAMPHETLVAMQRRFVKAMGGAWAGSSVVGKKRKNTTDRKNFLPQRLAETLQAIRDGMTLTDIAKARRVTTATIVRHLEELAGLGEITRKDFAHLLPDAGVIEEIHEALSATGGNRLSPVFHALDGRYSFETIRLTRLAQL